VIVGFLYAIATVPEFSGYAHLLKLKELNQLLDVLESKTLDMRFRWRGEVPPRDDIVIVEVDEKADDELGRWASSGRRWIARLIDILHEGGARVVGFDVVLDEPDEGAALAAVEEIQTYYQEHIAGEHSDLKTREFKLHMKQVEQEHDYDMQLAESIRRAGTVVLGYYNFAAEEEAEHLSPEEHEKRRQIITPAKYSLIKFPPGITRQALWVRHSYGVEVNLPILSEAAKTFGYFNAIPHPADGYIRRTPLIYEYQGEYYPSLAMQMVYTYLDPSLPPMVYALGEEGYGSVNHIKVGNIAIPTDEHGMLLINYYGPEQQFDYYGISDVVLGRIAPDTFREKIVLLGFTADIYQDLHSTSFQPISYPGVETHATIIANILDQDFLTRPGGIFLIDLLILLLMSVLLGILLPHTRPVSGVVALLLCIAAVFGAAYYAFVAQKVWLNTVYPTLFVLLNYVALTSYKYLTEERRKKEVKKAFQHYVAPAVVNQMLDRMDQLQLGGERKELTALFSDIRGFTSISEKMTPEELVRFLNEYLSAMTGIVLQYEGTVDKYMGDAIMAFYGAPLGQADHAARACRTALDMMTRLRKLRIEWETRGLPPMNIGIGINSGDMSVGNMGSEERFDYTIMGDNVNLASRLEGINKQYGTNIVISQFTYALIREQSFIARELDSVRVKGKQEPVIIYELRGYGSPDTQTESLLNAFHQGLTAYKQQQWQQAIAHFQEVLKIDSDDEPAKLYRERCEAYQLSPPPADWDGVCVMTTK
jgi:adenylate cyclase